MATIMDRKSDKKQAAQDRLSRLTVLDFVLPTARRVARNDPKLRGLAESVRSDTRSAIGDYATELDRVGPPDFAVPEQLLMDPDLGNQLAAFAQAGLLFFNASGEFRDRTLGDRRAMGGSGSVTRTVTIGGRLLLETPRVVVQFAEGTDEADRTMIRQRYNLVMIRRLDFAPLTEIAAVLGGRNAADVSLQLLDEHAVEFAEPDFVENVGRRELNDPDINRQWHLRNLAAPGADISAFAAWEVSTGEGVKLAVIDNGFDATHADLQFGNLSGWYRSTADMLDADFVQGLSGMPVRNHGTACAGMATARGGNGYGGVGVAYGAQLMAIACISDQIGTQSTLARALGYAALPSSEGGTENAGADVIVSSLGPSMDASWSLSQTLRTAIEVVTTSGRDGKGIPLFWACTNGNFPISADEICSHPAVIAIGRSTSADNDDASGFGPELACLAPGVDVYLPSAPNKFAVTTGTSFAAPCAAGVAALVLGTNDRLSGAEVRAILEQSCDKVGAVPYLSGRNDRFGFGRVNAKAAVDAALGAR